LHLWAFLVGFWDMGWSHVSLSFFLQELSFDSIGPGVQVSQLCVRSDQSHYSTKVVVLSSDFECLYANVLQKTFLEK
jgi:hypothetical protein